jgi:type IV pilus assembly protein PilF
LAEVHYTLGYYFEQIGEVDSAKQSYLKAIAIHPSGGVEHNNYGAFLCRQKHYRQAEKEFLTAVEDWQYTHTAQALENAGMCLLQIPDKENARLYFEKALRHDPKSPNALLELAQILYEKKEFKQAKQYLLQYQQIFPANTQSLLLEKKLYLH